ncbi:MAG TPA: hypothetical protein IAC67_01555 [Candidatus Coproplasma excrementipullorum]|nr:hypothetical protein [Candidatus Coproplasma excrementipullorum]
MGVNNNGSGQTKADLLLTKVDKLAQQNRTLDAKVEQLARQNQTVVAQIAQQSNSVSAHVARISQVNDAVGKQISQLSAQHKIVQRNFEALSAQNKTVDKKVQEVIDSAVDRDMDREAIMLKMEADKKELVQEIEYLSAQIQSMYKDALKSSGQPAQAIDLDELAAKVADKIIVPDNSVAIDYEVLAEEVAKRLPAPVVDYDELGSKVVENMYIPSAIVEDLDYDLLAEKVASKLTLDVPEIEYDALAENVAQRLYIPQAIVEDLDYDALAKKLAENLPAEEVVSADYIASKVAEQIVGLAVDEQSIADKVADALAERIDINIDSEELADRIAKQVGTIAPEQFDVMVDEDGCDSLAKAVESKLDYDAISAAVSERLAGVVSDTEVDSEEIARLINEKLNTAQINEEVLADKAAAVLSNYLPEIDTDEIAEKVAAAIPAAEVDGEAIAASVAQKILEGDNDYDIVIDEEGLGKITQAVSDKIAEELAADRDIVVDETGADAISDAVANKVLAGLDMTNDVVVDEESVEKISYIISENIRNELAADRDIVVDEDGVQAIASSVAEKINIEVPAAEVDNEAIASSVAEKIAADIAADRDIVVDEEGTEAIGDAVAGKVATGYEEYFKKLESDIAELREFVSAPAEPAEEDIDIVLDEEGVGEITDEVARKVSGEYDERLENIQKQIEEIKAMLAAGVVAAAASEELAPAAAEAYEEEEPAEEQPAEEAVEETAEEVVEEVEEAEAPAEEIAEEPAEEVEEATEEVAEEQPAEEAVEEAAEEVPEEVVEEPAAEEQTEEPAEEEEALVTVSDIVEEAPEGEQVEEGDEVIGEIVDEIDENPSEGEIMPDGIPGISSSGVDFANMMKYNRSFIARIIQSTDEQKRYYGQVKNALLAYKKVNSNIAWGAERFNKGRETIARFKIRGKTLCLYLALDPNEFATSVYHHTDVSDNKSMHGTPMMVKIKSPRGVKKAIRLIDIMLEKRNGVKREIAERDYAAMYPYETIEELIEEGLVKDVSKK